MAQDTYSAAAVASAASKALGRTVTPKQVRSWVRDHLPAYSKADHPEYQSHAYDAATVAVIVRGLASRSKRGDAGAAVPETVIDAALGRTPAPTADPTPDATPDPDPESVEDATA